MTVDPNERLLRLFRTMQGDMLPSVVRAFGRDDVQLIHSAILVVLDRQEEPPTVNQLAAEINRSVSRTSRLVDQLARQDLVLREEDGHDRRTRRLRLTEEGVAMLRRVQQLRVGAVTELIGHLTAAERDQVIEAMELLARAARRIRDGHDPAED